MAYQALILRDAARAAATVQEFEKLGITSWCARLIDAIWPQDTAALSSMAAALRAGSYDWLVLTSATTVAVLHELLDGRPLPQSLELAVVGAKTAQSARELLGLETDFQPEVQSAAGMAAQWAPPAGARICYPHGDLASGTLGDFLAGLPVQVDEVIAYRTVDAGTPGRPVPGPAAPEHVTRLDPAQIGAKLEELDLVVFSAPSIVRRFVQLAGGRLPERVHTLAIGQPTARALEAAGLPVHGTAQDPGPVGLAQAARGVLGIDQAAQRTAEPRLSKKQD